jgi:oxaloacetate decarboxylase alpha subunit
MNDPRNLERSVTAVRKQGRHAQGTLSYTVSPVHNIDTWVQMGARLCEMGADSIAIKDMAGLLTPYNAYELVNRLKNIVDVPIHMHCHATTGLSTATYLKAVEAGIDNVDTAISSMSMTYGHSPTEAVVAMLEGTERGTGLDIRKLEEVAAYFREVRKKYARFEGALRGTDSRILVAQVPGGMLTNLEHQLREQKATARLDEVLEEIPRVREDLGFIPLVTPTSQIVGTQSVMNVLLGERYKNIALETEAVLKGEYGSTPAPVNSELQARVLCGDAPITCRPADNIEPEFERLKQELLSKEYEEGLHFGENIDDDVLTYALFPQVGLKFLANRTNPSAFEARPQIERPAVAAITAAGGSAVYTVEVSGEQFVVKVTEGGDIESAMRVSASSAPLPAGVGVTAPLAGNIFKIVVQPGDVVASGDVVLVLEAMKMETEIRAASGGTVNQILVREGDAVDAGHTLITLG